MADQKISELTELAAGNVANDDELAIVDTDAVETKRWTWASIKSDILSWLGFTATEASYLSGVTSAIQTQIDGKADSSHTHTLTDITDSGALAALDTVGTAEIDNDAVTFDKIANIATNRVLARSSAGSGSVEALTLPNFRTLINVEDGADVTDTTNVTAAGALMDSEVTDLAGIKSLDTSTLQVKPAEGAFVDGDKTKLDGIETGATADQTGAEIKALYEAEANTNAFTDAEQSKLSGIESGADVTDETNVVSALSGATLTDAGTPQATDKVLVQDSSDLDNLKYVDFSDFSSGNTVDVVSNVAQDRILGRVTAGSGDSEELTATQVRTLINVEDGATADQTAAEIKTAYESNADTNAFTDAEQSKLSGIEASADVTDTANVTAAGALMDSEVTDLVGIKSLDTSTLQVKPAEGAFVDGDKTKLDGIETGATSDQTDAEIETAYNNQVTQVSAGEKTAGTELTIRRFSPKDIADMASTHGGGGGGSPLTTKGDLFTFSTVTARLPVGTDGQILQADSGETTGLKWESLTPFDYAKRSSTSTQSINGTLTSIPWQTEVKAGTNISWSSGNNTRLTVANTGTYLVGGSFTVYSASSERVEHIVEIRVNGVAVGHYRGFSYLRNISGGADWSYGVIEMTNTPIELSASDYVEIFIATVSGGTYTTTNNGTTNFVGDKSEVWLMTANGIKGDTGAAGTDGVDGADGDITWEGAWDSGTTYTANQAVEYDGSSYVCILGHTNQTPPNATYWELMAQKGATGATGGSSGIQTATASTATANSVDLSTNHHVEIDGDASFNLSIIDSADLVTGAWHFVYIENSTAGQITVTDGLSDVTNLNATTTLNSGEWLRLMVMLDNTGNVHLSGGIGV